MSEQMNFKCNAKEYGDIYTFKVFRNRIVAKCIPDS